jgi:mono/diheme cytochrome c family protein
VERRQKMHRIVLLQILLLLVVLSLSFAACRATGEGATASVPTSTPEATAESTRITDATAPATHVWKQPTTIIKTQDTPAAATATPASADDKTIARGKGIYEKRECGQCHGDDAEGVPDKGAKLAGTSLTEVEFKDILRTGGKGELGNEHIYGITAISESGISAVYAFLQSLED